MRWVHSTSVVVLAVMLADSTVGAQTTRHVPSQYPTIQAGINAAHTNDIVLVGAGTYSGTGNVDLDFAGKAITVRGEDGQAIIIDFCADIDVIRHSGSFA